MRTQPNAFQPGYPPKYATDTYEITTLVEVNDDNLDVTAERALVCMDNRHQFYDTCTLVVVLQWNIINLASGVRRIPNH
jgi:hypothetical protein